MSESDLGYESARNTEVSAVAHTDWFGVVLGAFIFLLGIGLLVWTFMRAADMFSVPSSVAIGSVSRDITQIGTSFGNVLLRIGLLLVMSIVGSIVSGKGIRMYLAARARTHAPTRQEE